MKNLRTKTIDRKIRKSAKVLSKLIKKTLDEIINRENDLNIDFVIVKKKIQEFNLEFERLNNWSETKLKETNQERKSVSLKLSQQLHIDNGEHPHRLEIKIGRLQRFNFKI